VVDIAERDPWRKKAFGSGHYLASTLGALRAFRKIKPNIAATGDGTTLDGVAALMQVHDPYTYFGRFPLSLGAAPENAFHLGIIKKLPARAIPSIAWGAFRSKIGDSKHVSVLHDLTTADFDCAATNIVQADGELLGHAAAVTARHVSTDLKVLI
jgi:diacylglycerol kinase family enzyme